MSKSLLVLAASTYQLDVIKAAKNLGYRVITTDNRPENPGHALADKSYATDTTDSQGVLNIAREELVSGVICAATDVAMATAEFVTNELGLPGLPRGTAQVVTQKAAFRTYATNLGLPQPQVHSGTDFPLIESSIQQWIVKPNRASGSKGIVILRSRELMPNALQTASQYSLDGQVVLEEFINGSQHTMEGVMKDGEIIFSITTDRDTAVPPHVATIGHRAPTSLEGPYRSRAKAQIQKVLNSLNVRSCVFDCDFVATVDETYLLEISPRLGGNSLSKLVQHACGFNIIEYAVKAACDEPVDLPEIHSIHPTAVQILGVSSAGVLSVNSEELKMVAREPWVVELTLDRKEGDTVFPFTDGRYRVGEAVITGSCRVQLDSHIRELHSRIGLSAS